VVSRCFESVFSLSLCHLGLGTQHLSVGLQTWCKGLGLGLHIELTVLVPSLDRQATSSSSAASVV